MHNLMTVVFEAHHHERNHHRRYEINVGRDLLNDWIVNIDYGRCGHHGHPKQFVAADAGDMQKVIRERLLRRLSAPKRIGCRYHLHELKAIHDFNVNAWLPPELFCKFIG